MRLNAIIQPEQFVEIGDALGKELGIKCRRHGEGGDPTAATSRPWRSSPSASKALQIEGKTVHHVGIPIHWGFKGMAKPGYLANTLTPFVGDANSQTPEFKSFLVKVEKL